jgi:hypothetical protein
MEQYLIYSRLHLLQFLRSKYNNNFYYIVNFYTGVGTAIRTGWSRLLAKGNVKVLIACDG